MTRSLSSQSPSEKSQGAKFNTTRWSMVLASHSGKSSDGAKSLEELCEQYWPPLYAFVRCRGYSEHDAQDLTQAFFARLLDKNWLASADPSRGRFRTFLLTAIKRFLANEWDRERAIKRGGGHKILNMDSTIGMTVPDRSAKEADSLYDRQWAIAILERVLRRLQSEFVSSGRSAAFELLKPCLTAPRNSTNYQQLANSLGVQLVSARSAVHRFRARFKELFREEIMHTVDVESDIDTEMRSVIASLGAND